MSSELSPKVLELLGQSNKETVKIEPVSSGLIKNPTQEDPNYWRIAQDMALSVPQGVVNAVEEQGDFLDENIVSLGGIEFGDKDGKLSFKDFIPRYVPPSKWKSEEYSKKRQLPTFHKPETLAGDVTEGISRFITGFAGPAKFLKGAGLTGGAIKNTARAFGAGAVADLTVFDPNEGRLSDMLIQFDSPVLNNAVTQYLASNENDTEMEGRLKNVLEGMALGGIVEVGVRSAKPTYDAIFYGIKSFKKMRATQNLDERALIQKETAGIIDDVKLEKKTIKVRKLALEGNEAIDINKALKMIKTTKENAKKDSELWIKKVINTGSFKSGKEVVKTIDDVVDNVLDDTTKNFLENDVLSNQTAEELAKLMSRDKEEVLKSLFKEGSKEKNKTVRMIATKQILQDLAFDYQEASTKYLAKFGDDVANWSKESQKELALRSEVIAQTFAELKKLIRESARTTQAGRIKVSRAGGKILEIEKIADIFKNYNANPAVMAKKIRDMKPEDIINEVTKSKSSKIIDVFNSLYINSILSGTPTYVVNILGNAYETFLRPAEIILGAALRKDTQTIRSGFAQYQGMIFSMRDTFKAVGTALRQGDAVLDPLVRTQDNLQIINGKAVRPISASNLGFDGSAGTWIDRIGKFAEFPTRLLMGTDELFKQISYRGRLYAEAVDNTLELKFKLGTKEANENIDKIFKNGFDENGLANVKDNPLAAKALQEARYNTFTNSLDDGRFFNIGGAMLKVLEYAPFFRFLIPFVKTPTNIWRHFESRIPVFGRFFKPMRDAWNSGDRRARADVLGRQVMGISATLVGWSLVTSDVTDSKGNVYRKVTGAGPKDFNIKKTWLQNGWQPYSLARKNDDGTITYLQYNRNDPRFYMLGILADLAENKDGIDDEKAQNIAAVASLSVMRSFYNKAYVRGISDMFEVVEDATPDKISRYFGRMVGNTIPYQAFIGAGIPGVYEGDKEVVEARSFVDEIIKKTPLITKTNYLEPRRDLLTGEPIERNPNSIYVNSEGVLSYLSLTQGPLLVGRKSDLKEDPVALEIMRLKVRLTEPNQKQTEKVDLIEYKKNNQSAHNYWVERIGKTEIKGRNLKEQLEITINSFDYNRRQEGDENFEGGKELIIKRIFQNYKDKAFDDMLTEYPEVKEAITDAKKEKYGFRKLGVYEEKETKELLPRK
jgi:hypothetical protein